MSSDPDSIIQPESLETTETNAGPGIFSESANSQKASETAATSSTTPNSKGPLLARIRNAINIYFVIFILLVITAAIVIFVSLKPETPSKQNTTSSLTDQQLSALKGNTTLIGDAKQTLDIQSNSIFEGQVLVRSDLNVAGAIKVGGGLTLPSVSVAGTGNFGQLGINGGINVGGDTILQGQLTVQKNLSVGGSANFTNLSVSQLNVTSLNFKGDLSVARHISTSGGNPSKSNGSALGSGGTASVSGSDTAGSITINTGSGPSAGLFITISFVQKFASTPHVVVTPIGSAAAGINYYVTRDVNGFSVGTTSTPPAGSNFGFDYLVLN